MESSEKELIEINAEHSAKYSRYIKFILDNTNFLRNDPILWRFQKIANGATVDDLLADIRMRQKGKR